MRHWSNNLVPTTGTSAAQIEGDLKDLINALQMDNVKMVRPVFFMAPSAKNALSILRDSNGNLIYPELKMAVPTLWSYPVFTSTNIPVNLGAGGNESEVYLTDMNDALIGEIQGIEIAVDTSASYTDGASQVSSFERDQTLMRAIERHDFAMRHDESVGVLTGITWQ